MAFAGATFPQGAIFLPYGRRAFGATHILARHQKEMESKGFSGLAEVPDFVATILRPRAPFFFEGGLDRKSRLAVVQSMSGTVILQLLEPTELAAHYSVVTAYLGFVKHGRRIGALL